MSRQRLFSAADVDVIRDEILLDEHHGRPQRAIENIILDLDDADWQSTVALPQPGREFSAASNTDGCFQACIGHTVIGVLFNVFNPHGQSNRTLVFEDGHGLTICANGSFWIQPQEDVARAIRVKQQELGETEEERRAVLALAGRLDA